MDSGDASMYLKALGNRSCENSHLVDFDGNGADKLVLTWKDSEQTYYKVWRGVKKLVFKKARVSFNGVNTTLSYSADLYVMEKGDILYLYEYFIALSDDMLNAYTVKNDTWILQNERVGRFQLNPGANNLDDGWWVCKHNGASVSYEMYTALMLRFWVNSEQIRGAYVDLSYHSVHSEVLAARSDT